jgi:hypothetical protein
VTQNGAASTTSGTPPVIQINGDNPAVIRVGDTYADPGATITKNIAIHSIDAYLPEITGQGLYPRASVAESSVTLPPANGRKLMGVLLIACSTTGKRFSTGVEIERSDFQTLPQVLTASSCPFCESEHFWWTREAFLADVIPPAE